MAEPPGQPIPLARPELGAREEELALEVLRSGRLSLGPMVERFERELAAWLEVPDAVAGSRGTAGLHLGVRALGWGGGGGGRVAPPPVPLRRPADLPARRGPPARLLRRRPGPARPRPRRCRRRGRRADRRDPAGPRLRLPGGHGRARGARLR